MIASLLGVPHWLVPALISACVMVLMFVSERAQLFTRSPVGIILLCVFWLVWGAHAFVVLFGARP